MDEEVRGIVIGGNYVSWQVFYNGVMQSQKDYAENDAQAIELGTALIAQRMKDFGGYPCYLFPEKAWEIRIY